MICNANEEDDDGVVDDDDDDDDNDDDERTEATCFILIKSPTKASVIHPTTSLS